MFTHRTSEGPDVACHQNGAVQKRCRSVCLSAHAAGATNCAFSLSKGRVRSQVLRGCRRDAIPNLAAPRFRVGAAWALFLTREGRRLVLEAIDDAEPRVNPHAPCV